MEKFRKIFYLIICLSLTVYCLLVNSKSSYADLNVPSSYENIEIQRSLESLRDLDYQTWQLIVYPSSNLSKKLILRIVGYPGSLRMDHPTNLLINSGRKNWNLQDITKIRKDQIGVFNDSAAEFDLSPLIVELKKNRPLRLNLPGLINDLSIPPYLVSEWRKLAE